MDDLYDEKLNEALRLAEELTGKQQSEKEETVIKASVKSKNKKSNTPKKLKDPWSLRKKILVAIFIILVVLVVIPGVIIYELMEKGKTQISENAGGTEISFNDEGTFSQAVSYNDKKYLYNEDVITVLLFGVDNTISEDYEQTEDTESSKTTGEEATEEETRNRDDDIAYYDETGAEYVTYGGRVDMCFLLVFNKKTNEMNVISVNRDSMTDVNICTTEGDIALTAWMQLTLAYSYGDGGTISCENFVDAVSGLFFGLPINAYIAVDMDGIADINDVLNGVTLLPTETLTDEIFKNESITLEGEQAYIYLERMDVGVDSLGSNAARIARQNQYLVAWVNRLLQCYDSNKSVLKDLYEVSKPYVKTNLDFYDMVYLAYYLYDMNLEITEVAEASGEYSKSDFFDEYIVDEAGMTELILKYFYVEQ